MSWTPQRIEQLRDVLAREATATEAARLLGIGRNAVLGKAHREGIPFLSARRGWDAKGRTPLLPMRGRP